MDEPAALTIQGAVVVRLDTADIVQALCTVVDLQQQLVAWENFLVWQARTAQPPVTWQQLADDVYGGISQQAVAHRFKQTRRLPLD